MRVMHFSSETPTPEKHGAYVGVIRDWTFLCAPWGEGLRQFRQLSSLMSNTERRLGWDRLNARLSILLYKSVIYLLKYSIFDKNIFFTER